MGDTYFTIALLLRTHPYNPGRWGTVSRPPHSQLGLLDLARPGSHSGEATRVQVIPTPQAEAGRTVLPEAGGSSLRLSTGGVHSLLYLWLFGLTFKTP